MILTTWTINWYMQEMNTSPCILPLTTAWPNELWREIGSSWETLDDFLTDPLLDGRGGSRECELRLWWGFCSSSNVGNRGLLAEGNISGVCLLVSVVERNELLNLDNVGVPRNVILGDGTLLYRSIDCLKFGWGKNKFVEQDERSKVSQEKLTPTIMGKQLFLCGGIKWSGLHKFVAVANNPIHPTNGHNFVALTPREGHGPPYRHE